MRFLGGSSSLFHGLELSNCLSGSAKLMMIDGPLFCWMPQDLLVPTFFSGVCLFLVFTYFLKCQPTLIENPRRPPSTLLGLLPGPNISTRIVT